MITEYDSRQLRKMKRQLASFKAGDLSLPALIGDLEFLLNAMESIPIEWKRGIHEQIATLEEVYAITLDRGLAHTDELGMSLIKEAIKNLDEKFQEIPESQPVG